MSASPQNNVPAPEGLYDPFYNTVFTPEDISEEIEKLRLTDPRGAQFSVKIHSYRFYTQKDGRDLVTCDRFLGFWVELQSYDRTSGDSKRLLKAARKKLGEALNNKKLSDLYDGQWPNARILYEQLYNAARRYLEVCRTDRMYNSLLFGLMQLQAGRLEGKMLADFIDFALIYPARCGLLEDFPVVGKAAYNAWMDLLPRTRAQVWERIIDKFGDEGAARIRAILYDEV